MLLPAPGSPDFTRVLLDALQAHPSLYSWDFDGTLVAVFLLARIVRRGGVIVDVPGGRRHSVIARAARTVTAVRPALPT